MIKFVFTTLMLFVFFAAKSQEAFIDESRDKLTKSVKDFGLKYVKTSLTSDKSMVMDMYSVNDKHLVFLFFQEDRCHHVTEVYVGKETLISQIKKMNEKYKKISDDVWISKNNEAKIELFIQEDRFVVEYTKI